jgi:hypothetical protein
VAAGEQPGRRRWLAVTLAQLGQLATYDRTDINASFADPLFRAFSIAYAAAFVPIVVAVAAVYLRQARAGGMFGLAAFGAALLGTMWLGADMWFEAFCSPWLLEAVPTLLTLDKAVIWQVGYLSSFALFALGWILSASAACALGCSRPLQGSG